MEGEGVAALQRRSRFFGSPLSSRLVFIFFSFVSLLHDAGFFSPASHLPFFMTVHGYYRRLFFHTCNEQNFQWIVEAFPGDMVRASCRRGPAKTIPPDLTSTICKGSLKTGPCPAESQVSYRALFPTAPADFQFFESFDMSTATLHIPSNLQPPYPSLTFGWQGTRNSSGESPSALVTVLIKDRAPDLPPDNNNNTNTPTDPDNPPANPNHPSTPGESEGKPSAALGVSLSCATFFFSSLLAYFSFSGW